MRIKKIMREKNEMGTKEKRERNRWEKRMGRKNKRRDKRKKDGSTARIAKKLEIRRKRMEWGRKKTKKKC